MECPEKLAGRISGPVIYNDKLVIVEGLGQDRFYRPAQKPDPIMGGNDNGYQRHDPSSRFKFFRSSRVPVYLNRLSGW